MADEAPGLYLCPTPIGNLEDITLRVLRLLREADVVAAEDTRRTRQLLRHFGIDRSLVSLHAHNEAARLEQVVSWIREGKRVAFVSDAGTPGLSDPGERVVRAVRQAGLRVVALPGASAGVTALVGSGLPTAPHVFLGFLPRRSRDRRALLGRWGEVPATVVAFEAPHRLCECLEDAAAVLGDSRHVVVARELTKVHEEYLAGPVREVVHTLRDRGSTRGEVVLLIAPPEGAVEAQAPADFAEASADLPPQLKPRERARRLAERTGRPVREAYAWLLRQEGDPGSRGGDAPEAGEQEKGAAARSANPGAGA